MRTKRKCKRYGWNKAHTKCLKHPRVKAKRKASRRSKAKLTVAHGGRKMTWSERAGWKKPKWEQLGRHR